MKEEKNSKEKYLSNTVGHHSHTMTTQRTYGFLSLSLFLLFRLKNDGPCIIQTKISNLLMMVLAYTVWVLQLLTLLKRTHTKKEKFQILILEW